MVKKILFLLSFFGSQFASASNSCTGPNWEESKKRILEVQDHVICRLMPEECKQSFQADDMTIAAGAATAIGLGAAGAVTLKQRGLPDICKKVAANPWWLAWLDNKAWANFTGRCELRPEKVRLVREQARQELLDGLKNQKQHINDQIKLVDKELQALQGADAASEADLKKTRVDLENKREELKIVKNRRAEAVSRIKPGENYYEKKRSIEKNANRAIRDLQEMVWELEEKIEKIQLKLASKAKVPLLEKKKGILSASVRDLEGLSSRVKLADIAQFEGIMEDASKHTKLIESAELRSSSLSKFASSMKKTLYAVGGKLGPATQKAGLWLSKKAALAAVGTPFLSMASTVADVGTMIPEGIELSRKAIHSGKEYLCKREERTLSTWVALSPVPECKGKLTDDLFLLSDESYQKGSELYDEFDKNPELCELLSEAYKESRLGAWGLSCNGDKAILKAKDKDQDIKSIAIDTKSSLGSYELNSRTVRVQLKESTGGGSWDITQYRTYSGVIKSELIEAKGSLSSPEFDNEDPSIRKISQHLQYIQEVPYLLETAKHCCSSSGDSVCSDLLAEKRPYRAGGGTRARN